MISYFPGGWLAGLYFATFPSYTISLAIHAFLGASIALIFWGAMIRATRNWAPPEDQGKAFGIQRNKIGLREIFALSVTVGATIAIGKMWLKPIAALLAGYVADNFGIAKSIAWLFVLLIASFSAAAALPGDSSFIPIMLICLTVASMAVFAMRGIYFALLEKGGVPLAVTGTATGVISTIAFTPDIFMPLLSGVLLDNYPGELGYRYFFSTTAAICGIGLIATIVIYRKITRRQEPWQTASLKQTL